MEARKMLIALALIKAVGLYGSSHMAVQMC